MKRSALAGRTMTDAGGLADAGIHDLSDYGGGDAPTLDLYIDLEDNPHD